MRYDEVRIGVKRMIELIHGDFSEISRDRIGPVDLIVADPPDNIGLKYNGFKDKKHEAEYELDIQAWLTKMKIITEGPIFFTFNSKWTGVVEFAINRIGMRLIQRLQWYFTFGQDQTKISRYALCHRPVYWLNSPYIEPENIKIPSARQIKYNDKRAAPGGKMPPNVWEFPRVCGTFKEKRKHCPTQLPEGLVERIVKGHCCPGGRVLDPFMGTGTTARVCQRLEIDCVSTEISEFCIQKTAEDLKVTYQGDDR